VCILVPAGRADVLLSSSYPDFTLTNLGQLPNAPASFAYFGLAFNGPNLYLSGGDTLTNNSFQPVYSFPVKRDAWGQIIGFDLSQSGSSFDVPVPTSGDFLTGGLVFVGNTLFYNIYPFGVTPPNLSYIGQYVSSNTSSLTAVTVPGLNNPVSLGGLAMLPGGRLVISSVDPGNLSWSQLTLSNPTNGLYTINFSASLSGSDPVADSFVPFPAGTSVDITANSILVGDSSSQALKVYGIDGNGNPTGSGSLIVTSNTQGIGYGLVQDPQHPTSFLFTTADNNIWLLTGVPEPTTAIFLVTGILLFLVARRRTAR
jgi:hypothetical protein